MRLMMAAASDPTNIAGAVLSAVVIVIGKVLHAHIASRRELENELRDRIADLEAEIVTLRAETAAWQKRYIDIITAKAA
jgi:hypothetical protein